MLWIGLSINTVQSSQEEKSIAYQERKHEISISHKRASAGLGNRFARRCHASGRRTRRSLLGHRLHVAQLLANAGWNGSMGGTQWWRRGRDAERWTGARILKSGAGACRRPLFTWRRPKILDFIEEIVDAEALALVEEEVGGRPFNLIDADLLLEAQSFTWIYEYTSYTSCAYTVSTSSYDMYSNV